MSEHLSQHPVPRLKAFRYPSHRPAAADFLMLTTMYAPPRLPERPVLRERLLERLQAGVEDTPLTLVSGSAGSGKTTLAASWLERAGVPWPVVWLTLSEATESPEDFWFSVTEALRRAGVELPHYGAPSGRQAPSEELVIDLATDLLERDEPVVLVLDEVERLVEAAVPGQLELLLRLVSRSLRLVLLSRVDPLLPIQRYQMAGTLTQIRTADLAFTVDEARELLLRWDIRLSTESLRALVAHTEGWAAGLQLAALSRAHLPAAERNAETEEWRFGAQDANLAEYLTGEVLDAQPAPLRDFLLRTSVLDTVCAELAEALTGEPGSAMALLTLLRSNILMEAGGEVPGRYRAHPLLRELLRAQLAYLHPDLVPDLHLKAARWFARQGMVLQAVSHYGAAGRWAEAADMVVDGVLIGEALRPSTPRLVQRLADMPEDTPGSPARVVRAAIALAHDDVPACDVALGEVEPGSSGPLAPQLDVAVATTRLAAAASHANPLETLACAARAEEALSALVSGSADPGSRDVPDHPDLRSLVLSAKGTALLATGELPAAALTLTDAVGACAEAGFLPEQLGNLGRLALAESLQGHLVRARELVDAAVALAREPSGEPAGALPPALVVADAWVLVESDDADAARTVLLQPTTAAEPDERVVLDAVHRVLRARAERARGRAGTAPTDGAGDEDGHALPQLLDGTDALPAWLCDVLTQEQASVHLAAGQAHVAQSLVDRLPEPKSSRACVLHARVGLAGGDPTAATLLDPAALERAADTPVDVQVDAWLLKAQSRLAAGDRDAALTALRRGVRLARPELLRRPLRDAAREVRGMLRGEATLASSLAWLDRSPGSLAPTRPVPLKREDNGAPGPIIVDALSPRETEVLRHLADLLTTEEVAATMFVSVNTVKSHIRSILRKLSVSRRNEAIRRARELQVI